MTITVEELRRKYPNPRAHPRGYAGEYCVGWALRREVGSSFSVVDALRSANPNLSESQAEAFLAHIIAENDAGNFDVAWAWLDKGLSV